MGDEEFSLELFEKELSKNITSDTTNAPDNLDTSKTSDAPGVPVDTTAPEDSPPGQVPAGDEEFSEGKTRSVSREEFFLERPANTYPFPAIVGQDVLKKALLLNITNHRVGGLLIRGEKGTGKSITVRSLVDILPEMDVVAECGFNCDPKSTDKLCKSCKEKNKKGPLGVEKKAMRVIYLPLNITEDRLVGTIDIERVLSEGVTDFEPGLLAQAHRNVLYIDEINLLEDNIVDLLLDAAAMGVVTVEREGISFSYPSEFILIGSMNPQEGELRPQLLDRLALQAEVKTIPDIDSRVRIIKHSRAFMEDSAGFRLEHSKEISTIKERIEAARTLLPEVTTPTRMLALISHLCIDFNIDGHRGDIIIERTARTHAALECRKEVTTEDVVSAAEMALPHRMRKQPFEEDEFNKFMLHKLVREYEKNGVI